MQGYLWLEDEPDPVDEVGQFLGELGVVVAGVHETQQLLADGITSSILNSELLSNSYRCFTLIDPDLVEGHPT